MHPNTLRGRIGGGPAPAAGLNVTAGNLTALAVVAATWLGLTACPAISLLSNPTFTASTNAPLAGVLNVATDRPSRLSVSVFDGATTWTRNFYDYGTAHAEPLYGFKPGRTNLITVTVYDQQRHTAAAAQPVVFVTSPLPAQFPGISLLQSQPALMEPGYTLFLVQVHSGAYAWGVIVDATGTVVWYGVVPSTLDLRQLANGDLFMPWTTNFNEINLLGQTVKQWNVPGTLAINEHDGVPTPHGTILYLSDANETVTNYPTSVTVSNAARATASIIYQNVVEISSTNSALLNLWTPLSSLDPYRISYLVGKTTTGWDAEHSNAVIEDPSDNSWIVSMRHQNALFKFSRATGKLVWILGDPANWGPAWQPYLLTPVGTPFLWPYGQHAPVFTPSGTLMVYDDGNYRASPWVQSVPDSQNYSRAVEYSIDEQAMTVSQVWDYGRVNVAQKLFTNHEGNAEPEPVTGNVLINFSDVTYINNKVPNASWPGSSMVRLTEVTHAPTPQIVFDLAISMFSVPGAVYEDCTVYRAHRIPDLYGHPALPVGDLTVSFTFGVPWLQFSADDTHSYLVESSADLRNWTRLGAATETAEGSGQFTFLDLDATAVNTFFRVLTQ